MWGLVYSLYKAHKSRQAAGEAEDIVEEITNKIRKQQKKLEKSKKETQRILNALSEVKVHVFNNQIKHLVDMSEKYKSKLSNYDESFSFDEHLNFNDINLPDITAPNIAAMKDFFFSGSLVLSLFNGWESEGEKQLEKAKDFKSEAKFLIEQMKNTRAALGYIQQSASEIMSVISELVEQFEKVKVFDMSDNQAFEKMFVIGVSLKKVLSINVLHEDGTVENNIRAKLQGYLELR